MGGGSGPHKPVYKPTTDSQLGEDETGDGAVLAPPQVRRVLDYIDAHLTDELGLVELAAIAGLSPHHFVEAFKISIGKPPHRFVTEKRVQRALELLRVDDRSIAEIAHVVGFSSQSHLTMNFRRVTGLTPGRFRRSLG